jgi:hypothetical protein
MIVGRMKREATPSIVVRIFAAVLSLTLADVS